MRELLSNNSLFVGKLYERINHSRCALVIWSSLQLTSKQWIITQQFTAGADLFLKYTAKVPKERCERWHLCKCLPMVGLSYQLTYTIMCHDCYEHFSLFYLTLLHSFASVWLLVTDVTANKLEDRLVRDLYDKNRLTLCFKKWVNFGTYRICAEPVPLLRVFTLYILCIYLHMRRLARAIAAHRSYYKYMDRNLALSLFMRAVKFLARLCYCADSYEPWCSILRQVAESPVLACGCLTQCNLLCNCILKTVFTSEYYILVTARWSLLAGWILLHLRQIWLGRG